MRVEVSALQVLANDRNRKAQEAINKARERAGRASQVL